LYESQKIRKEVRINIGEYCATKEPTIIYTLLGSCVSVCLFDPETRIGGMNHIFLPGRADLKHYGVSARYGINAMEMLINEIMGLGGNRHRIVAKTFGGAHILPSIHREIGVGIKIVEFVKEFLKRERIRVISHDLGGNNARKVYFKTNTGDVYVKRIASRFYPDIVSEEQRLSAKIRRKMKRPGSIDLF